MSSEQKSIEISQLNKPHIEIIQIQQFNFKHSVSQTLEKFEQLQIEQEPAEI